MYEATTHTAYDSLGQLIDDYEPGALGAPDAAVYAVLRTCLIELIERRGDEGARNYVAEMFADLAEESEGD